MRIYVYLLCCVPLVGGSIEGRVTDSANGAGIGGVVVTLMPSPPGTNPLPAQGTITEDSGVFHLANVPDGEYLVLLNKPGYIGKAAPAIWNASKVSGETPVNLEMTRLASLNGRVVDAEKKPVAGVTVVAEGGPLLRATTDENGVFVVEGMMPGTYALSVPVKIPSDAAEGERMVTTFYPSALNLDRAERVSVKGQDVSGYEIQMQTALVHRIRGVVLDVNGEPRAQATVGLIRPGAEGKTADDVEQVLTDDDGKFEFAPAQEGEYIVQGDYSLDYDYDLHHSLTRSGSRKVTISRGPLDPVEIRLAQPFAIQASLDWSDGNDPAAVHPRVRIHLDAMDREPIPFGGGAEGDVQRIEGLFPGRYRFEEPLTGLYRLPEVVGSSGYYLASMMFDGLDVLGKDVEISGPGTLRLVFRRDGGTLRGRAGQAPGATVWLVSDSGRTFYTICAAEGQFTFSNLPPGGYVAGALQTPALQNMDVKKELAASGTRVRIEASSTATVELQVK